MPKFSADPFHVAVLQGLLESARTLKHLRVRAHGDLLILESGPVRDAAPHARFRRVSAQWWRLEMPNHMERWQPTPMRGTLAEMFELLTSAFPWTLEPFR
jgi:hypothetical protein